MKSTILCVDLEIVDSRSDERCCNLNLILTFLVTIHLHRGLRQACNLLPSKNAQGYLAACCNLQCKHDKKFGNVSLSPGPESGTYESSWIPFQWD